MQELTTGAERIEQVRERIEKTVTCPISGKVLDLRTAVSVWSAINGSLVYVVHPDVMDLEKREILKARGQAVRTFQDFKKKAA